MDSHDAINKQQGPILEIGLLKKVLPKCKSEADAEMIRARIAEKEALLKSYASSFEAAC